MSTAAKPLFNVRGLLPQHAHSAVAGAHGPRDTTPEPQGITRPIDATPPTRTKKEKVMSSKSTIKFNEPARSVVQALIQSGPLNTAALQDATSLARGPVWNGCYQAKKLKYIEKKGTRFHVTDAGRKAVAVAAGTFAAAIDKAEAPPEKPVKKITKQAAAELKAIERNNTTRNKKTPSNPIAIINSDDQSYAVQLADGGVMVLDNDCVIATLTREQYLAVARLSYL